MTKVSIIIPAYKRVSQTLKTIELLFNSNGFNKDFFAELIVADSSPDSELKTVLDNKLGEKIIYTRPEKPGIATNKNQGAKIAKNPILIFCDSDMEVEPNTIVNTVNSLKKHPAAATVGGKVIWCGGEKNGQLDRPRDEDRMMTINETTYTEAIYSRYLATYKEVFWPVGGYDQEVFNMRGEGSDLSVRYWRAGYPLVYDESIIVHHVHETEGGIIRGVSHPEWGIAKDLLLLAYKYNIDDKSKNFANTVAANFEQFGKDGYYRIIEGIKNNYQFIKEVKSIIDRQKREMKTLYNFKFLEIFSQKELLEKCINEAENKLLAVRKKTFQ
jgi:GT2 family glycosyltransferase